MKLNAVYESCLALGLGKESYVGNDWQNREILLY